MNSEKMFYLAVVGILVFAAVVSFNIRSSIPDEDAFVYKSATAVVTLDESKENENDTETVTESEEADIKFPVEINRAGKEELMSIPGIGEAKAEQIIEYRESAGHINTIEELKNISGFGEKTIENLKKYLIAEPVKPADSAVSVNSTETSMPSQTFSVTSSSEVSGSVRGTTVTTEKTEQTVLQEEAAETSELTEHIIAEEEEPETVVISEPASRRKVNINTADAAEISDALLISRELAEKIVSLRNRMSYFSSTYELVYIDEITPEIYYQIVDYIEF